MPAPFAAAAMEDRQQPHRQKQRPQRQSGHAQQQQAQQQPLSQFQQVQDPPFAAYGCLAHALQAPPQQQPLPPQHFAPEIADRLQHFYVDCAGHVAAPAPVSGPGKPRLGGQLVSTPSGSPLTRSTSGTPESPPESESHKKLRAEPRRTKVQQACVYCRRSHMTCDNGRPCQRCIKRSIGHLCHDQRISSLRRHHLPLSAVGSAVSTSTFVSDAQHQVTFLQSKDPTGPTAIYPGQLSGLPSTPLAFASEHMGNEFAVLNDFIDQYQPPATTYQQLSVGSVPPLVVEETSSQHQQPFQPPHLLISPNPAAEASSVSPDTPTERFFITAVDQAGDGSNAERLTQVIQAKFEAGLLKPYDYATGYARLLRHANFQLSAASRQRIQAVLARIRPRFRKVAQSLTDIDLVLVEEAFERLLLIYDRVFSSMGVPSCLWRRTGEIYKANKEFAELIGVGIDMLREGKLCIHELMTESSAVNYWEKYGSVAFDPGQKAVLTSSILVIQDPVLISPHLMTNTTGTASTSPTSCSPGSRGPASCSAGLSDTGSGDGGVTVGTGAAAGLSLLGAIDPSKHVSCCFSFTIRRDKFSIPSAIVGNFLPINCHT